MNGVEEFLVKATGGSFLVYRFKRLDLIVKVKPVASWLEDSHPPESHLTKLSPAQFEAITNHYPVVR